ncbi:TolB family protein [Nocardia sp. 004]|uniref:TolB family protein n=1 Tax=Nocardia sp. 004 TaxID=3385978 RepID=UPI00399FE994
MLDRRKRTSQAVTTIVMLVGLLTGCEAKSGEVPAPAPVTNPGSSMYPSKIAFTDNGGPSGPSVYVMNSDGTAVKRIAAGYEPDFAPDGSKIVIRQSWSGLLVMNPDGSNPVQLVDRGAYPEFAADGTRIVFACHRRICVVDADGTNLKTLTQSMGGERLNYPQFPTFSPDGSRIAFTLNSTLWLMNADGTDLRILLEDAIAPVFTPDGSGIVFASGRGGHDRIETYLMDADGRNIRPLTGEGTALPSPDPYHSTTLPAFSPDGTHLLVTRSTQNSAKVVTGSEIWVMNPDGSDPRRLTEPNQPATAASWGGNSSS